VHHRAPRDVFTSQSFHEGLALLARMGLSFDAWAFFQQQGNIASLPREHSDLNVVVLHGGGLMGYGSFLGRGDAVFTTWHANMAQVANCPNVSIKLGGMLARLATYDYLSTEAPESSATLAVALGPYLLTLIVLFGPAACSKAATQSTYWSPATTCGGTPLLSSR
jgi:L-fuconolactonase